MPVDPIEAVADAIMQFEGWKPGSRSYMNRNPGNLRLSPKTTRSDAKGYSIFLGFQAGYSALTYDLYRKFTGENVHGLDGDSTLEDLMNVYAPATDKNDPAAYAIFVAGWLERALDRPISHTSKLREVAPALYPAPSAPPPGAASVA